MSLLKVTTWLLVVLTINAKPLKLKDNDSGDLCYLCACYVDDTVDCSSRSLADIPEPGNTAHQVKKLNLSNNIITSFPTSLSKFSNLVTLDISQNGLHELPQNAFDNLKVIEYVSLSRNSFESWLELNPNDILQPLTNLRTLDLSHNKFKTLGNLANDELLISSSLETLILENCEIDGVYGRSPLGGMSNIQTLNLNSNPLNRLQNLISPTLKNLHLNNCELNSLYHNELTYLPALSNLTLAHNYRLEISTATYTLFSESLKYLDISYCNVMQPSLRGFPNLRKAILNHNLIRELNSNAFVNNSKLETLDLSYNNIGSLRSDTFQGLNVLRRLDLSWNEIAQLPEDSVLKMPSLTHISLKRNYLTRVGHLRSMSLLLLDLSYCEINIMGKDSLEGFQSLLEIDLSHNLLSHIPESLSSNTLKILNLNYNRISSVNNFTFFMLPKLSQLSMSGNRFTTIWNRSFFESNPFLTKLDLSDNMWRCDCNDNNMYDFYEFVTLEPNKIEESYNLLCNSPNNYAGQTWLEACYFSWFPTDRPANVNSLIWFIIVMITGLALCILLVNCIRSSMKRRLEAMQAERERQVEEARDRLRQMRIRAEQEAQRNTPDPRDLIAPPSYDEALSMPKLNTSCNSLCETGSGKMKRRRGRRKTKSSGDLLEETERNGDMRVVDLELTETSSYSSRRRRRRRRPRQFGSHEIADLDQSPGARRRRMSEYGPDDGTTSSITVDVEAELTRPLRPRQRRYSSDDNEPRESDF